MTLTKQQQKALNEMKADTAFMSGVNCALAVVAGYDEEGLWREIVSSCGGYDKLRHWSAVNGNLKIDGFAKYRKEA